MYVRSSNIDELTSRTFFKMVGKDKPAVVLFHEYMDVDCQVNNSHDSSDDVAVCSLS